jgi:peptide/nickel transport system substrate-binding protein
MLKRLLGVFLALIVLAGACARDEAEPDQDAGPEGQTTGEPVEGGTLVVGSGGQLPAQGTLNPAVNTQGGMQQAAGLLFSGLVEIDENAEPVAELATDWEIEDDGRVYVFSLRDDVVSTTACR